MKLNLRAIDLNLLTIFESIMTHKKMSRAAEQLHMTQPAVSHALARLRTTFNDELFVRTRGGMKPTPKALSLADPIRDALLQIQEALDCEQEFDPATAQRSLSLSLMQYGEITMLPRLLNKIEDQAPNVSIESVDEDPVIALDKVRELAIDFCFDVKKPEDERLDYGLCGEEEWAIISRKDHPRLKSVITPAQYFKEQHVVLAIQGERKQYIEDIMATLGGERKILAEAQQLIAIPTLVMGTDAIATLPRQMIDYLPYRHHLNLLETPLKLPATPLYLIWHRAMNKDQGHQWLKDLLLQV